MGRGKASSEMEQGNILAYKECRLTCQEITKIIHKQCCQYFF